MITFEDLGLDDSLLDGLHSMGFEKPTPIQEMVLPHILDGKDVIACAQTGTGKTAAYLLPVLDKISRQQKQHTTALIVSPTRELALQIDHAFQGFSYFTSASSIAVYGGGDGQTFDREKKAMTEGVSVIIATPGRLISHLNLGYVKLDQLDFLVLDEADKMLDMGFYDDILKIIRFIPAKRQNLLFSATMPPKIRELARKIMNQPEEVNIAISKPAAGVKQGAYVVHESQKPELLKRILSERKDASMLVFASTKQTVKDLERSLKKNGFPVKAIHSDLSQEEREAVLLSFRTRQTKSWWRPIYFPVASTSITSVWYLITMCRAMQRIMYTVSEGRLVRKPPARRSLSSGTRTSGGLEGSSNSSNQPSPSWKFRMNSARARNIILSAVQAAKGEGRVVPSAGAVRLFGKIKRALPVIRLPESFCGCVSRPI